jgi:regulator of replication initiation timing
MSEQKYDIIDSNFFRITDKESTDSVIKKIEEGKSRLANYIKEELRIMYENKLYRRELRKFIEKENDPKNKEKLETKLRNTDKSKHIFIHLSKFDYTERELNVIMGILLNSNYNI